MLGERLSFVRPAWLEARLGSDQFCPRFGIRCLARSLSRLAQIRLVRGARDLARLITGLDQLSSVRFGTVLGVWQLALLGSKLSSSWQEAWFGEVRGFVRLINSGIRPARTRLEARYLLGSALFETRIDISVRDRIGVGLGARLS